MFQSGQVVGVVTPKGIVIGKVFWFDVVRQEYLIKISQGNVWSSRPHKMMREDELPESLAQKGREIQINVNDRPFDMINDIEDNIDGHLPGELSQKQKTMVARYAYRLLLESQHREPQEV